MQRAHTWRATSASLLASLSLACAMAQAGVVRPADTVFVGGAVYTVDAARSWASAVAVDGDRIVYVGSDRDARRFVGPRTRVVDLRGRMLLPGFRDSHVHPSMAPNPATALDVSGLATREAIVARIREYAARHPDKPWIVGTGWAESAFLPSGQPDRKLLDEAVPGRPAFLTNNSQHMAWVNSAALAAARVDAATPDPANGRIERNAQGVPTGVLQEAAMDVVRSVIPPPTTEERATDLLAALQEMHRRGITAMEEAVVNPPFDAAYVALARAGRIDMRTRLCLYFDPARPDDEAQVREFVARRAALAIGPVQADCVKIVLDGAYGSHTVALLQPYSDEPARFGSGQLFVEPQRLASLVTRLDAAGFRVHVHTIGDRAVRAALDAFAEARRVNGARDARHTLAHLSLIDPADIRRFRELGVVANMSPLWGHGNPWETVFATQMFGPARALRYRTRTLLDAGVVLAWGSDWPVSDVSPLAGIEVATTRRHPGGKDAEGKPDQAWLPEERLTLPEALTAYTAGGAYLAHEDDRRGTIAVGRAADLVLLDRNLFDVDPLEIHAVSVDLTMVGGKVVYERR